MQSFAKKIGMTHYYDDRGLHQVATVLELEKTVCAGIKSSEKNGYEAAIYALIGSKCAPRSIDGQFKQIENIKALKEQKGKFEKSIKIGEEVGISDFTEGDLVMVRGVSKGKGFAGTIKRHGFNTGPKTHGSNNYRQPGSIGDTGPSHVVPGKKMAGRMGYTNVKIKSVKICKVEPNKNRIWVNSPVPGAAKSKVLICKYD